MCGTLIRAVASFARRQEGALAVVVVLSIPVMLGISILAIDFSQLYVMRNRLQATADAAALAAVIEIRNGSDITIARTAAMDIADVNMPTSAYGAVMQSSDIVPGRWDSASRSFTAAATPTNAVRVVTRRASSNGNPVSPILAGALGVQGFDVVTAAIAVLGKSELDACLISLDPSAAESFYIHGTSDVTAIDCNIQINSCHPSRALRSNGNLSLTAEGSGQINVCGGVSSVGPGTVSPSPNTGANQTDDPFAELEPPAAELFDDGGDCDYTNFAASGTTLLYPGVYCGGITLTGSGTVTFEPTGGSLSNGLYIMKDGPLDIGGSLNAQGNGVGFFLTGNNAVVDVGGTVALGLQAATSGSLAGMVFWQDGDTSRTPAGQLSQFRGTALTTLEGAAYFPNGDLYFRGTADGELASGDCTVFVARRFEFNGTTGMQVSSACTGDVTLPGPNGGGIRLVD